MSRHEIRAARHGDVPAILDTLRAALGESPLLKRTPDLWGWKHEHNPFGESMVLVAVSGSRIAGVRAMMRWELHTSSGNVLKCLRPVDTATHPDFVRRGIFRDLTMSALEQARSEGVHLVFNTPNEKSAPGYQKMGWETVADVGVMVRPRLGRVTPSSPKAPPSIVAMAPNLTPSDDDSPFERAPHRNPTGLRTPRTLEYLRWRFNSHPTASYGYMSETQGGLLMARANTRRGVSELVLSDLIGATSASVRRFARTSRARYVAGWFAPSTPERRTAILGGMIPIPRGTLRLLALPLEDLDTNVLDLASWDLATSDLELL